MSSKVEIPIKELVVEMMRCIDPKEIYDYIGDAIDLSISYEITDCDYQFTIAIVDGIMTFAESIDEGADVILQVNSHDFHNITLKKINPMSIILGRKLKFKKGDISDMIIIGGLPIDKYYEQACKNLEVAYA